ncbi:MAG: cell division protein FtsQ [Clostridium sp.]|jgi:cell division protein FtsQ|nr:cell division protein FtsQ [Clostridium sp.]
MRSGIRKKKRWIWPLILLVPAALLAGGIFYIRETYTIREVYVEGNLHYTKEEIMGFVMKGPTGSFLSRLSFLGDNSLYLSFIYRQKGVGNIPFVDTMDVSILSPDTIKITVYEKALAGYIEYLDSYLYFDKDGYAVESSKVKTLGVPQVTGFTIPHMVLGERLPVEEEAIFDSIMNITSLLKKYGLTADKIHFSPSGETHIHFGAVRAALGSGEDMEEKIMRLPQFLPNLTGRKGTLHMENLNDDSPNVTFTPEAAGE